MTLPDSDPLAKARRLAELLGEALAKIGTTMVGLPETPVTYLQVVPDGPEAVWMRELGPDHRLTRFVHSEGFSIEELCGKSQKAPVTAVRHACAAWLVSQGWSLSDAGRLVGRTHSTVVHSVREIRSERRLYSRAGAVWERLQEFMGQQ